MWASKVKMRPSCCRGAYASPARAAFVGSGRRERGGLGVAARAAANLGAGSSGDDIAWGEPAGGKGVDKPQSRQQRQPKPLARTKEDSGSGNGSSAWPHGDPSAPPVSTSRPRSYDTDLTLSLLVPFGEGGLPPKGKTRHQKEEECDPWTQNCKTESHVWESKCEKCYGTGKVVSGFKGHRTRRHARRHGNGSMRVMATCAKCCGTGWVRHSSARRVPAPFPNGNPNSPNLAVARKSLSFQSQDFDDDEGL